MLHLALFVAAESTIGSLTRAALYAVQEQHTVAFVKYTPANCQLCDAIDGSTFWSNLAEQAIATGHITVWSARCVEPAHQAVCKDRSLPFEDTFEAGEYTAPVFEVWTGAAWRRYAGEIAPEALLQYFSGAGWRDDQDPRHITIDRLDPNDAIQVSRAKHIAQSPISDWTSLDWASLGEPTIGSFTQAALYAVQEERTVAYVKYTPANCQLCDAIDGSTFWSNLAEHAIATGHITVWSARCVEPAYQAICKDRGLPFEDTFEAGKYTAPVFEVWTGAAWRRYIGEVAPTSLLQYFSGAGWRDDQDPRHIAVDQVNPNDPFQVSRAKHIARSPISDWASLGTEWPAWEPCDTLSEMKLRCALVEPKCTTAIPDDQDRGLGNKLAQYAHQAAAAFSRGCTIAIGGDDMAMGENKLAFREHFVSPPPLIPSKGLARRNFQSGACTLSAITQLQPDSLAARRRHALWAETEEAPTVGLHLRTGWADAKRFDEWRSLQCDALAGQPGYDPTAAAMWIVTYSPEFTPGRENLTSVLDNMATAADSAFGVRQWKLHIASDSTSIARHATWYIQSRAKFVRSIDGPIGHDNAPEFAGGKSEDVGASTVADFVALRDSDMLIGFMSNFVKRAGQAAVCPQRWLELRSRDRDDDVLEHVLDMNRLLRGGKGLGKRLGETNPPRPLKEHVPPNHPCLRSARPLNDCACFYKFALDDDEQAVPPDGLSDGEAASSTFKDEV